MGFTVAFKFKQTPEPGPTTPQIWGGEYDWPNPTKILYTWNDNIKMYTGRTKDAYESNIYYIEKYDIWVKMVDAPAVYFLGNDSLFGEYRNLVNWGAVIDRTATEPEFDDSITATISDDISDVPPNKLVLIFNNDSNPYEFTYNTSTQNYTGRDGMGDTWTIKYNNYCKSWIIWTTGGPDECGGTVGHYSFDGGFLKVNNWQQAQTFDPDPPEQFTLDFISPAVNIAVVTNFE